MSTKKFAIIIGVFVGAILLLIIIGALSGGQKPAEKIAPILQRNLNMRAGSDVARNQAGDFELRVSAASASIIIASDNTPLSEYFAANFQLPPPAVEKDFTDKLNSITETSVFDSEYNNFMRERLQNNLDALADLINQSDDANLKAILQTMRQNQTELLEEFN